MNKYFLVILIGIVVTSTVAALFLITPAVASHLYNVSWDSAGNEFPDCFESYLTVSDCNWSEEYFQGFSLWSNVASAITLLTGAILTVRLYRRNMVVRNN